MGIKYKVDEKFFDKWSRNMSYLLGYIYADGHIIDAPYMRGKYLYITSTDKDSIDRIKEWLKSEHLVKKVKSHFSGSKDCYILRIGSHKICKRLYELGLHPRKSLTVRFPEINDKYFWDFIRGYFDGDGCVYLERRPGKNKQLITSRIRVIFTSGSKIFLQKMNDSILKYNINNGKIYNSKRSFQLVYGANDSVQIFYLMYKYATPNSFFMRKFNIFNKYFELIPKRKSKLIEKVLNGHVVK